MTSNKNKTYLDGINSRNSKVLQEIYKDILPGITNWVRENGGNQDDAKDLFQEMIISIYKKCQTGNFELSCTFWSYALVVCRNLWFAKNRNKDKMIYTDTIGDDKVIITEDVQKEIEQREQMKLYKKHFSTLGESCQKILSMFFDKVKMTEIAAKLDMTPGYIKKKKFNCKEELIQKIKADALFEELSA